MEHTITGVPLLKHSSVYKGKVLLYNEIKCPVSKSKPKANNQQPCSSKVTPLYRVGPSQLTIQLTSPLATPLASSLAIPLASPLTTPLTSPLMSPLASQIMSCENSVR